jgi:hypothetical protein
MAAKFTDENKEMLLHDLQEIQGNVYPDDGPNAEILIKIPVINDEEMVAELGDYVVLNKGQDRSIPAIESKLLVLKEDFFESEFTLMDETDNSSNPIRHWPDWKKDAFEEDFPGSTKPSVIDRVLKTEYSEKFDEIRKHMMVTSFFKYGPLKENYSSKCLNSMLAALNDMEEYHKDGNTEHLADAANQLMIEFMCPQKEGAHYSNTDDSGNHVSGMSVNEIKRFKDEEF